MSIFVKGFLYGYLGQWPWQAPSTSGIRIVRSGDWGVQLRIGRPCCQSLKHLLRNGVVRDYYLNDSYGKAENVSGGPE